MPEALLLRAVLVMPTLAACPHRSPQHVAAKAASPDPRPVFEMTGPSFVYDGHPLRFGDPIDTWVAVLGPPTRKSQDDRFLHWDRLGIEVGTPSGNDRHPVVDLLVRVGQIFPGTFRLQGVPIGHGRPFKTVQAELPPSFLFSTRGHHSLPEDAIMNVSAPNGALTVHALFDCVSPTPGTPCTQFIDELEVSPN